MASENGIENYSDDSLNRHQHAEETGFDSRGELAWGDVDEFKSRNVDQNAGSRSPQHKQMHGDVASLDLENRDVLCKGSTTTKGDVNEFKSRNVDQNAGGRSPQHRQMYGDVSSLDVENRDVSCKRSRTPSPFKGTTFSPASKRKYRLHDDTQNLQLDIHVTPRRRSPEAGDERSPEIPHSPESLGLPTYRIASSPRGKIKR